VLLLARMSPVGRARSTTRVCLAQPDKATINAEKRCVKTRKEPAVVTVVAVGCVWPGLASKARNVYYRFVGSDGGEEERVGGGDAAR
jgi:hypothetical protein